MDEQLFIFLDEHGGVHTVRVITVRPLSQEVDIEDVATFERFPAIPLGHLRAIPSGMRT